MERILLKHEYSANNGFALISNLKTEHGLLNFPAYFPAVRFRNFDPFHSFIQRYKEQFPTLMINACDLNSPRTPKGLLERGIHKFLRFDGIVFCDGGGFSKYSQPYNQRQILRIQDQLGSDIASSLDYPVHLRKTWHRRDRIVRSAKNAVQMRKTVEKSSFLVYASVHGRSSTEIINVVNYLEKHGGFDGYAIGSLVPLQTMIRHIIRILLKLRTAVPNKPIHVYGLTGLVLLLILYYLGIDSVDSHGYLLSGARRNYYILGENTVRFSDILESGQLPCKCPICKGSTPEKINSREQLAFHNYWVVRKEMAFARKMIERNRYKEYLENRLVSFPLYTRELGYMTRKMRNFL
jgi:7-cyano-7-deazaguanine tRNA-ribosyltransferase